MSITVEGNVEFGGELTFVDGASLQFVETSSATLSGQFSTAGTWSVGQAAGGPSTLYVGQNSLSGNLAVYSPFLFSFFFFLCLPVPACVTIVWCD